VKVDPLEIIKCSSRLALAFKIHHLATRKSFRPDGFPHASDDIQNSFSRYSFGVAGNMFERRAEHGIATENRDILTIDDLMHTIKIACEQKSLKETF
jgi:hypothetical protein